MKVAKIITSVVIVLLVALAIGLVFKFTNGFNEDFKTFYLEHNGKQILTSETETSFKRGEQYRYEVKYTFDSGKSEPKGYSVKVMPNTKLDFTFTADGKQYVYANAKELTSAFNIKKEDSAFTISIPNELKLQTVLEKVYGKTVEVEEPRGYLYTLIVSSYNEKVTYYINFGTKVTIDGIEIDQSGIVFGRGSSGGTSGEFVKKYSIEYDNLGSGGDIRFECVKEAAAGETVTFTVSLGDHYYDGEHTLEMGRIVMIPRGLDFDEDDEITLGYGEGTYSFTMPATFVTIMIYTLAV